MNESIGGVKMKEMFLPDGWSYHELGQVLSYEQPTKYIVESTDYNDKYFTPVLTAGKTFIIGYTNEEQGIYEALPVIIFDDFTTATQYVNFKFKVKSSAMKILTADEEQALTKFLYYMMQIIECEHDTHKRYWIQKYSKIRVPLPSVPEQERIVARIEELFSELDKGVEVLQITKAQLKVYRQSVLKDAFEGKLTIEWRKDHHYQVNKALNEAPRELIKDLPSLPSSWIYVSLEQLGDLGRGKSRHRPRNDKKLFENGKYPFIQTGEIKAAKRFITTSQTYYGEFGLQQSKLWPIGTLCITIAANIAETAFLGIEACFPDSIVGFKNYESVADSDYVEYFIQSAKIKLWAFAPAKRKKYKPQYALKVFCSYCSLEEHGP